MLTRLLIHNVVLIEKLELNFSKGLTIFSGETGAGKSVLLSAISMILGGHADVSMIRTGADKLSVEASFDVSKDHTAFWNFIQENGLEIENDEVVIKRLLGKDGKSKIFVSDQAVSLKLLKQIGETLAEINGQFESVGLLKENTHIGALDDYGGYQNLLLETAESFKTWQKIEQNLKAEQALFEENIKEKETLEHYAAELENARIFEGEEAELLQKRSEMMNAEKLSDYFKDAYHFIQGEEIAGAIRHAASAIERANVLTNGKYDNMADLLNSALSSFDEAGREIERATADLSFNESEINAVEERLFALKALSRKHGVSIDELPAVLTQIQLKLQGIQNNAQNVALLEKELITAREKYENCAGNLHEERLKTARILEEKVENELCYLKMAKAKFRVLISENTPNENGSDAVLFEAMTNEGQPFAPLHKIASGGELSRFMLALKVNLAHQSGVETLIFDEIDSGVGGAVAEAVGNRLHKLSEKIQVFAVTHSPQISAFSQTHFKVEKINENGVVQTNVRALNESEKKEEIARMLSGEVISNEARAAAEKLISA